MRLPPPLGPGSQYSVLGPSCHSLHSLPTQFMLPYDRIPVLKATQAESRGGGERTPTGLIKR